MTMKASVIIPTLNAEKYIENLLSVLLSQTVAAEIIVIDSGSTDGTLEILQSPKYNTVKVIEIESKEFDHGGTRNKAFSESYGEYVLFLTQDALPTDKFYIENLLSCFSDEKVAAVCGRQIARPDAPEYEKLTREYNYPSVGRVWDKDDIHKYGVKTYFFSDVCSAYRRTAFLDVGGFDSPIIANEDMMIAGKFINAGFCLAYTPKASVYHSHAFSLKQEYQRNVIIGQVMEEYKNRLIGSNVNKEGCKMALYVIRNLIKSGHFISVLSFIGVLFAKYMGNKKGRRRYLTKG